jgi:hypothetical protein
VAKTKFKIKMTSEEGELWKSAFLLLHSAMEASRTGDNFSAMVKIDSATEIIKVIQKIQK